MTEQQARFLTGSLLRHITVMSLTLSVGLMAVFAVAFGAIFALSGVVGPIMGQNFGAGLSDRVRGSLRDVLIFAAVVTVVVSLALFLLRAPLHCSSNFSAMHEHWCLRLRSA